MRIGEVSARSGISARMLRHYDRIGLLTPAARTSGGYRDYTEQDLRRLVHIENLRSLGIPLSDVAAALDDATFSPAEALSRLLLRTRERLAELQELAQRLERVRAGKPQDWDAALRTVELMRGLQAADASERQRRALVAGPADAPAGVLVDALLREDDTNAAGALAWAVARRGDDAVPALLAALDDPDEQHRYRALAALEKIDSDASREALGARAADPDPRIRARARVLRARAGDASMIGGLVAQVAGGFEDVAAGEALAGLAVDPTTAAGIAAAVGEAAAESDVGARRRLVAVLADIPGAAAADVLAVFARDRDRGVGVTAAALHSRRG
ncbi:MerR family transcriptional regulator [Microbacterium sp. p3-SID336]|uniref:MerR family transcriptional regulator n=1 Tax=Microbacterium sp. p3-SID336 TaxID=2916212 RepID=UPI0021A743B7|nr:MerR family transcriptional regulator [Microbacterium sp. p3-SID336]MCT1477658.1 MerR family transcriptional regulator [Microbacterium sp. p3-SID336]